jgi:hypothetical protein
MGREKSAEGAGQLVGEIEEEYARVEVALASECAH